MQYSIGHPLRLVGLKQAIDGGRGRRKRSEPQHDVRKRLRPPRPESLVQAAGAIQLEPSAEPGRLAGRCEQRARRLRARFGGVHQNVAHRSHTRRSWQICSLSRANGTGGVGGAP